MKTSKVKAVQEVKEWGDGDRKTYYHNLEMDNGDKINIGKKKQQVIGDELTYEIIGDEGQHEYTKAKTVNPDFKPKGQKSDDYIKGIEVGHAVNNAVNMICAGVELDCEWNSVEEKIYKFAKKIMAISNRLKQE